MGLAEVLRSCEGGKGVEYESPKDEKTPNTENSEENQWSRRQFLVGTAAIGVAGAVTLFGRQSLVNA
ncbi:twin-arginine translocation signal domain-containing protein, partial [Sulfobacillus sp. hq2]|uniref:twin-arginine translocation signal domain-containing protein n=1 Tax=Sulfobacillus sp. hq2 TaxID=2039167 RepID=UPI000D431312